MVVCSIFSNGNLLNEEVIEMAVDPVCGMTVDEKTAPAKSEYKGKTYYFCNPGCKKTFDANPAKFVKS
jgi:YHS domain-containing protein